MGIALPAGAPKIVNTGKQLPRVKNNLIVSYASVMGLGSKALVFQCPRHNLEQPIQDKAGGQANRQAGTEAGRQAGRH